MIVDSIDVYNGDIIHGRFAYQYFRDKTLPIGNILAFRAPMKVEADGMIDYEDVLDNDFIYSDDAINFVWEIPNLDSFGAVAWQRLFNTQIANILSNKLYVNAPIECSVSITYTKDGAALGHTAINVTAGKKAPAFAYSTGLTDDQCEGFMKNVIDIFYTMNDDMFIATTKIIIK